MPYCSTDTRKIIDYLHVKSTGRFKADIETVYKIELCTYEFYTNHICGVIDKTAKTEAAMDRAIAAGWDYFQKPISSMLKARGAAHRESYEPIEFGVRHKPIVSTILTNLCLADYNMTEQKLLLKEIPEMVQAMDLPTDSFIQACKSQGKRSIYYLHGVIKREFQTREGRLHEIQQAAQADSARAWTPPEDFEPLDLGERLEFQIDWQNRKEDINFNKKLREQTH